MIFMKWPKYYFHDPTTEVLQVLYNLFHYCITIDTLVPLLVIILYIMTITIYHLSSSQDGHLKRLKNEAPPQTCLTSKSSPMPQQYKIKNYQMQKIYTTEIFIHQILIHGCISGSNITTCIHILCSNTI